jgi:hypothetical protein
MDEDEIREFVKQMDLKKGHYYIILTDVGDDKFKMHAYDTTGNKYENEMDHSVGSVIHEGLVGILTGKSEEVFNFGMSELAFNYTSKRIFGEIKDENGENIKYKDNVIKVDFGNKH